MYSIWHQYKLKLRNKAGWRLHFAVHAYFVHSMAENITPLSTALCTSKPALRQKPSRAVTGTGPTAQLSRALSWGSEKVRTMMTGCKASRLIPSTVTQENATTSTPLELYYRSTIPSCENINMQGKVTSTGHRGSFLPFYCIHKHVLFYNNKKRQTQRYSIR